MKHLALVVSLLFVGCMGSPTPNNPMVYKGDIVHTLDGPIRIDETVAQPWWRAHTMGLDKADNPWEQFVPKPQKDEWSDPWKGCNEPPLFPKDWKQSETSLRNKRLLRLHEQRLKLLKERRKKLKEERRLDQKGRRPIIEEQQERKTF